MFAAGIFDSKIIDVGLDPLRSLFSTNEVALL